MSDLKGEFIDQYSISKTLRFELIPIGKTKENIQKDQILSLDRHRAQSYKKVKLIIDDFHRNFIGTALSSYDDDWQDLAEKINEVKKSDQNDRSSLRTEFDALQTQYRKNIINHIKESGDYELKDITTAPLIKSILKEWVGDDKEKQRLIGEFLGFDGYFLGLHDTRKNIYSDKAQASSLSFRIVHDNFPKFLNNLNTYSTNNNRHNLFADIEHGRFTPNIGENLAKFDREEIKNADLKSVIKDIEAIFNQQLNYFNQAITQAGIEKYNDYINVYNLINNLYKQHKGLKNKDLPNLTELFKQILAITDKGEYREKLNNDSEVIDTVNEYQQYLSENKTLNDLANILNKLNEYDLDKIYWKNNQITSLSNAIFDDWGFLGGALTSHYESNHPEPNTKTAQTKKDSWFKQDFSIGFLEQAITAHIKTIDIKEEINPSIVDYLKAQAAILEIDHSQYQSIAAKYQNSEDKKLTKDNAEKDVEIIKNLLDQYQQIFWLFRPLILKQDNKEKDQAFYADLEKPYYQLANITHIFNLARNFVTQKPYSVEKYKLNFENPTLAAGWDINKEKANTTVILRKNDLYYLAIMNTKHKKVFQQAPQSTTSDTFQKLNYKLLSGANKMLPKVFFSKKGLETFQPAQSILDLYQNAEHKKGSTFKLKSCHKLIDFFKENVSKYKVEPDDEFGWDVFGFNFSPTSSYSDISQFYKEVEQQGYKIWFSDIDKNYIDKSVNNGKLYLFQLYNKDFSPHSKGKKNLHTLYWQEVFSQENIQNTIYKLNGEAELFYRPASIKYDKNIWDKGHHANNPKKKQNYPIIKDRRFAIDKYFFHVPITINYKARDKFNFNKKVLSFLRNNKEINIIGIDRGEKNLAYYSVIDQTGNILEQDSFNTIANTNYHKLLDGAEKARDDARKNWKTINKIKDLKAGYISQVVHRISELMVKHNAIVVMEDLNMGMKRGRQKIEKQVYQNLEKALIHKLNYLAFKDYEMGEVGSIRYGLQLSAPFDSFKSMGKQTGFIFYVSAPYTSKIDFLTGYAPFNYFKHETLGKSQQLMLGIIDIRHFDGDFVIDIDYSQIQKSQPTPNTKWQLHLDTQERYEWNPKERENQKVDVYEKIKACFANNSISLDGNIATNIIRAKSVPVYKLLFKYLNIVSQMRFTSESGEDYILSPIKPHFRTSLASNTIPKDSDANGAYHIALKGLYMLHHKINKDDKNLFIKKEEWFGYAQDMSQNK